MFVVCTLPARMVGTWHDHAGYDHRQLELLDMLHCL